jgi:hypothetical protein
VLAAAVVVCGLVRRDVRLRRRLAREEAAGRLVDARLHHDLAAFRERMEGLLAADAAAGGSGGLAAVPAVRSDYTEGGPA